MSCFGVIDALRRLVKIQNGFLAICMVTTLAGCLNSASVSLCYDPVITVNETDGDNWELRAIASYSTDRDDAKDVFDWLMRASHEKKGSYSFCGVSCYVVCETNGIPACVAEILEDRKTAYVIVPPGSSDSSVSKHGSGYIVTGSSEMNAYCFEDIDFVGKVLRLKEDCAGKFEAREMRDAKGFDGR